MTIVEILRAITKRWWAVVLMLALGAVGAEVWTQQAQTIYQARVTFLVSAPGGNNTQNQQGNEFAVGRVNTYILLLTSDVMAEAIRESGVRLSGAAISGSAVANTVMLTAQVRDSSRDHALEVATAIGENFGDVVLEFDPQARPSADPDAPAGGVSITVVNGPSVGANPVSPRVNLNRMVGIAGGLTLGVALALILHLVDTRIHSVDELAKFAGVPVLGTVPRERGFGPLSASFMDTERSAARAESIRRIRTNLQFASVDSPIKVLAVSSAMPAEAKTTTVLNVGMMSAELGLRVILIDCDLRRPRLSEYCGSPDTLGLTDILSQRAALADVVYFLGDKKLSILPGGTVPPNPSELIGSKAMHDLVNGLRGKYDLILLDTPPLVPFTDAAMTMAYCDGIVVVVRQRKTTRAHLRQAFDALRAVDARVVGTILTMTPTRRKAFAGYGYQDGSPSRPRPALRVRIFGGGSVDDPVRVQRDA